MVIYYPCSRNTRWKTTLFVLGQGGAKSVYFNLRQARNLPYVRSIYHKSRSTRTRPLFFHRNNPKPAVRSMSIHTVCFLDMRFQNILFFKAVLYGQNDSRAQSFSCIQYDSRQSKEVYRQSENSPQNNNY